LACTTSFRSGQAEKGTNMPKARCLLFSCLLLFSFPLAAASQAVKPLLNLDQLVGEAVENNPEILAANKRLDVFREKVPQASALEDPMLGLGIVNLPTSFSFRDEDMTMKEISISQKFPFPGKRPLMREMAEKEADAASKEIENKTNRIIKEVKTAFYDLSHIYRATEVTHRNKQILENLTKIAETRYATGEGIQQDVLKAHVEISRMVDELIMLDQKRIAEEARLCSILNRSEDCSLGEPELVIFRRYVVAVEALQEEALDSNPTLKALKTMIEAKEKAHGLAKLDHYPDFTVRFAYGQRDDNDSAELDRRDMVTGMVEMNIPIYYKSKQSRKAAEALADIQTIQAEYRAMKNEIFYMVASMASMVQRTGRQLELYKTGIIPQASLQVKSAVSAYTVNKIDFMSLLDSQMTLYRYELEYHAALTEYEKNLASLEATVGKPFLR
jgi:outer membrane protein, heavy metal efflux system